MSQTLFEKLQLEDEKNILIQGLPSTVEKQFSKISFSKNVTQLLRTRKIDFALVFVLNANQLHRILEDVCSALHENTKFWIAFPKQTSKITTDLSREASWDCVFEKGLEGGEIVVLDYVWNAQRFFPANSGVNGSRVVSLKGEESFAEAQGF
ncbi:MAG TPA: hypothetical protein PLM81_10865 [Ginsengibacter sp.]|nr:hypothetical protein [Ginsengibacter sp.]HRP18962.1 hypothetical protein [Ginsengibacter sp.]HRP44948.1 hypothetical protein [Ginsengibacter sp.]